MKMILLFATYGVILYVSLELQKTDLLLGYTLGVIGILATTFFLVAYLSRKVD